VEVHAGIFGSTNQNPSDFERHRGFVDGRLTSAHAGDGGAIAAGYSEAPRLAFLRELPQLARHRPAAGLLRACLCGTAPPPPRCWYQPQEVWNGYAMSSSRCATALMAAGPVPIDCERVPPNFAPFTTAVFHAREQKLPLAAAGELEHFQAKWMPVRVKKMR